MMETIDNYELAQQLLDSAGNSQDQMGVLCLAVSSIAASRLHEAEGLDSILPNDRPIKVQLDDDTTFAYYLDAGWKETRDMIGGECYGTVTLKGGPQYWSQTDPIVIPKHRITEITAASKPEDIEQDA